MKILLTPRVAICEYSSNFKVSRSSHSVRSIVNLQLESRKLGRLTGKVTLFLVSKTTQLSQTMADRIPQLLA